jgi:hypothetical protein
MPLKSPELYKLARQELRPLLIGLGFKRTPKASVASWCRPEGERWLVFWFQPSTDNDAYSPGYRFTVEFALADRPAVYTGRFRERLPRLLTGDEREELRQMANRTIARLPPPDMAFGNGLPPSMREHWLAGWKPRTTSYEPMEHVWFRHGDDADVQQLMLFFRRVLPSAIGRFLDAAASAAE